MSNPTILDSQIVQLILDAGRHGDDVTVIVGRIAIGEEDPITASSWEERYGGGGYQPYQRLAVLKFGHSVETARDMLARQWQAWLMGNWSNRELDGRQ